MTGRPTKLTPERHQRIVDLIAGGAYKETAAALAGISKTTLYNWLARGETSATNTEPINPNRHTRAELATLAREADITLPPRATKAQIAELLNNQPDPYVDFLNAVKEAEAKAEAFALQQMFTVGRDDWRMWMTYLERTRPDRYSRRPAPEETDPAWVGDEQEAAAIVDRAREIRIKTIGQLPQRSTG